MLILEIRRRKKPEKYATKKVPFSQKSACHSLAIKNHEFSSFATAEFKKATSGMIFPRKEIVLPESRRWAWIRLFIKYYGSRWLTIVFSKPKVHDFFIKNEEIWADALLKRTECTPNWFFWRTFGSFRASFAGCTETRAWNKQTNSGDNRCLWRIRILEISVAFHQPILVKS